MVSKLGEIEFFGNVIPIYQDLIYDREGYIINWETIPTGETVPKFIVTGWLNIETFKSKFITNIEESYYKRNPIDIIRSKKIDTLLS